MIGDKHLLLVLDASSIGKCGTPGLSLLFTSQGKWHNLIRLVNLKRMNWVFILSTDRFFFFFNFFSLASELPTGNGHSLLLHAGSYDFAFICIWAKKGKRDAINWAHSQTPSLVAWARKLNFRTKIAYTKTFGGSRVRGPWAEQGVFGDHTEPVGFCHYLASWPLTLYSEQELMIVLSTGEWLYP